MKPCDNYMVATWLNVDMAFLVLMHHTHRCVYPKLQTLFGVHFYHFAIFEPIEQKYLNLE